MIVLDEQLLGRGLDHEIARWYRGAVCYVTDLRPRTVVKDEAIPRLLRQESQPTFVTLNERDFWRKVPASSRYSIVCFSLSDSRALLIPKSLRALLSNALFNTKAKRAGKVIRIAGKSVSYYLATDPSVRTISL